MAGSNWTLLSTHAHVMLVLARDCEKRLRDIALEVGITERAVQRIIVELVDAGVLSRRRVGRRNAYEIHPLVRMRHPLEENVTIRSLLGALDDGTVSVTSEVVVGEHEKVGATLGRWPRLAVSDHNQERSVLGS